MFCSCEHNHDSITSPQRCALPIAVSRTPNAWAKFPGLSPADCVYPFGNVAKEWDRLQTQEKDSDSGKGELYVVM